MKPRTKLHFEVLDLHKKLAEPIEHEPFVISNHKFYFTTHYKNLICLECNHSWRPNQIWHEEVIGVKCPDCNKKLNKISTENGGYASKFITYSVAQVVDRFQVVRYFSCWKHMSKNNKPRYSFNKLFEEWKDYEKDKSVIIGKTTTWTGDGFSHSDYEIRAYGMSYWKRNDYKHFSSDINCPAPKFLPMFKKYGLNKIKHNCDYRQLIEKVLHSPKIETLLKAKQKELLFNAVHQSGKYDRYWPQIKISLRHKYKIKDPSIWYDYLELLEEFGKDILNPKFILPKNLKKEHNALVDKKNKILERKRIEREIKRQKNERLKAEAEEALKDIKSEVFKDFFFKKGKIKIVPLIKESDVKKEGDFLNHCVYTNNYHKKSGILLMSARINGEIIETIEISLATYSIIQSRGYDNDPSKYHDEIISIVRQNMGKISKLVEKQKKLKEADSKLKELESAA